MSDQEKVSEKKVTKELSQEFAKRAFAYFSDVISESNKDKEISEDTKKAVDKRLSEKGAANFQTVGTLPQLVWNEVHLFCERIRFYPYTARYREIIQSGPAELNQAWQIHSDSLRHGEVYIIHERGTDLLRFMYMVSRDVGIPAVDRSKNYNKRFSKRFDTRLRERHRTVHVHERPSGAGRLTNLMIASNGLDAGEIRTMMMDLLLRLAKKLPGEPTTDPEELARRTVSLTEKYRQFAEEEAFDMIDIFVQEFLQTVGVTDVTAEAFLR